MAFLYLSVGGTMSFLQDIEGSFYSRPFYIRLLTRDQGIGMRFILLRATLTFISLVVVMAIFFLASKQPLSLDYIANQLPDITLDNSKLSMDRASPYTVNLVDPNAAALWDKNGDGAKELKDFKAVIIFDMSPRSTDVIELQKMMGEQHAVAFVTSDFYAIEKKDGIEIHPFSGFKSVAGKKNSVNHDDWLQYEKAAKIWGVPLMLVFFVPVLIIMEFVIALLQAVGASLLSLFFETRPDFSGAMRLGVAASMPVAIVDFIMSTIKVITHGKLPDSVPGWMAVVIWVGYVLLGLFSTRKKPE